MDKKFEIEMCEEYKYFNGYILSLYSKDIIDSSQHESLKVLNLNLAKYSYSEGIIKGKRGDVWTIVCGVLLFILILVVVF